MKGQHIALYSVTGEQWCPYCHEKMEHKDGYFECQKCYHSITDDEAEEGDGFADLQSTYEDDFGDGVSYGDIF